ncbi:HEPN domain-containing protein [Micromonospora sp. NBC_01813]|uniref:HEPN domain-containing protein n=1 Tax=Micromonospora sp. NBC_01813 TaxID=2975988 RepID=UPI002DDB718D|nr:HEPN domain-containing protein [Micromonospora sp. NBC_01813]WSA06843.1 hypothetical protein OG958_21510 [Micromonospora sp. NBC_01813]
MDPLNLSGTFWFPGSEAAAVHGTLVFDPADGCILTLTEPLKAVTGITGRREDIGGLRERVFGVVDRTGYQVRITLGDCLWLSAKRYHINFILLEGHFAADDTVFDQVSVRLQDLPVWVGQDALTDDVGTALGDVDRREFVVQLDRPPMFAAPFGRGELRLDFRWEREDVEFEQLTIRQWPQFELHYAERTSLQEVMGDVVGLRSLVGLCADRFGSIQEVKLYRSDHPQRALSGDAFSGTMQKVTLLTQFGGVTSGHLDRCLELHQLLATFEDIGGIATAARWLDNYAKLKIITAFMGTMRADGMFGANRFLNVCSAAEGFHRTTVGGRYMDDEDFQVLKEKLKAQVPQEHLNWFSGITSHANDPSLNRRLKELAAQLDGVAEQLVGDVVVWGRVVSTCRNESTHLDGDREEDDSPDLFYLAEGVFNVMRLCLLLHAGMDRAMLPKVANSRPASRFRDRPAEAAKRLDAAQKVRQREKKAQAAAGSRAQS